jgi:hypothetical protein
MSTRMKANTNKGVALDPKLATTRQTRAQALKNPESEEAQPAASSEADPGASTSRTSNNIGKTTSSFKTTITIPPRVPERSTGGKETISAPERSQANVTSVPERSQIDENATSSQTEPTVKQPMRAEGSSTGKQKMLSVDSSEDPEGTNGQRGINTFIMEMLNNMNNILEKTEEEGRQTGQLVRQFDARIDRVEELLQDTRDEIQQLKEDGSNESEEMNEPKVQETHDSNPQTTRWLNSTRIESGQGSQLRELSNNNILSTSRRVIRKSPPG